MATTAPSKMLLVTVNNGQLLSCCIIGTGGCSNTALGLISGSWSFSGSNIDSSCSASSTNPWVAAVRYARDPDNREHIHHIAKTSVQQYCVLNSLYVTCSINGKIWKFHLSLSYHLCHSKKQALQVLMTMTIYLLSQVSSATNILLNSCYYFSNGYPDLSNYYCKMSISPIN